MLNKILYFVLIVIISGCVYNPDAGKFIEFTPLQVSKSNSILLDKFEFEGTELDQFYKKLIIRQIKSDLANASNIIIYDYNKKLPQNTLKDPDLIVNIKFFLNETDEELSYYTPISLYKSSTSTNYSGSGRNARQSRRSSSSSSHELTQLPLNYGFFEFKSEIRIYNRKDLSLSQSKSVGILKSYASNNRKENYPLYKKSFILNNLHEISGLIVNSILFSSGKIERIYN